MDFRLCKLLLPAQQMPYTPASIFAQQQTTRGAVVQVGWSSFTGWLTKALWLAAGTGMCTTHVCSPADSVATSHCQLTATLHMATQASPADVNDGSMLGRAGLRAAHLHAGGGGVMWTRHTS